jgi:hypothetical protein
MSANRDQLPFERFRLNMKRIHGLVQLVESNESLKPVGVFHSDGVRADILRAVVVFLHATVEDVVRSRLPKPNKSFSFYSSTDLDKALTRSGIDATPLKSLYRPLTAMAKRKNQIVHDADLSNRTDTVVKAWGPADDWQLIMWLLAVPAFYYQLRVSLGVANIVERTSLENIREAMQSHVDVGKQLLAFPKVEPNVRIEALQKVADTLKSMAAMLELDVSNFTVNEAGEILATKGASK